eukprot:5274393-Pleurochrysis_carterae.AAC.2
MAGKLMIATVWPQQHRRDLRQSANTCDVYLELLKSFGLAPRRFAVCTPLPFKTNDVLWVGGWVWIWDLKTATPGDRSRRWARHVNVIDLGPGKLAYAIACCVSGDHDSNVTEDMRIVAGFQ